MTAEVVCRSIGVGSTMSAHRQAALLGLAPTNALIDGVASRYRTEAVRAFTRTLHNLLSERVVGSGTIVFDMVTHFHRTHIGDARSGEWRSLDPELQAEMARRFAPFLEAFGHAAAGGLSAPSWPRSCRRARAQS